MENLRKNQLNKIAAASGVAIAIQGLSLNFLITASLAIVLILFASSFSRQSLKEAMEKGEVTKAELQSFLIKSPYLWVGVVCFILLSVLF